MHIYTNTIYMHIQSSASPARARGRANKVARPSRYRYRCSANVYESTSTRAAGDRVFRCTYHKRTCLDVWSAYAAIMRRLSTKCFTKLHRGFRILAYDVRSRRLEPNVRQKSHVEARTRRKKGSVLEDLAQETPVDQYVCRPS